MTRPFFAGSYGGDDSVLSRDSKLECKICWHTYNPSEGDDYWQIPPNTPFSLLPDHWSCPTCGGRKADFLVVEATDS